MIVVQVSALDPDSKGINLIGKVIEVKVILERKKIDGSHIKIGEALIADATGCILITARNEQLNVLNPGSWVTVRNGKIDMFSNRMRLVVDRWGLIESSAAQNVTVNTQNNASETEYELVNEK